jgi:hypothetical protein
LRSRVFPEALRSDDDELVVSIRAQETVDLGRPVKEGLVEILRDVDVIGVHGPRSHVSSSGAVKGRMRDPRIPPFGPVFQPTRNMKPTRTNAGRRVRDAAAARPSLL